MIDTNCPHCGAEAHVDSDIEDETVFFCGSVALTGCSVPFSQSSHCELSELRSKVAAQQQLLDEIRDNIHVQTFDTYPAGYVGILHEDMLRRLGVKLGDQK